MQRDLYSAFLAWCVGEDDRLHAGLAHQAGWGRNRPCGQRGAKPPTPRLGGRGVLPPLGHHLGVGAGRPRKRGQPKPRPRMV